jgi:hypothetical protein
VTAPEILTASFNDAMIRTIVPQVSSPPSIFFFVVGIPGSTG